MNIENPFLGKLAARWLLVCESPLFLYNIRHIDWTTAILKAVYFCWAGSAPYRKKYEVLVSDDRATEELALAASRGRVEMYSLFPGLAVFERPLSKSRPQLQQLLNKTVLEIEDWAAKRQTKELRTGRQQLMRALVSCSSVERVRETVWLHLAWDAFIEADHNVPTSKTAFSLLRRITDIPANMALALRSQKMLLRYELEVTFMNKPTPAVCRTDLLRLCAQRDLLVHLFDRSGAKIFVSATPIADSHAMKKKLIGESCTRDRVRKLMSDDNQVGKYCCLEEQEIRASDSATAVARSEKYLFVMRVSVPGDPLATKLQLGRLLEHGQFLDEIQFSDATKDQKANLRLVRG